MVYFYYKLALPTGGKNPDVIDNETTPLDRSNDPTFEPTAKSSEQFVNSFARYMEGDGLNAKERE